jgi:hypothetical protein
MKFFVEIHLYEGKYIGIVLRENGDSVGFLDGKDVVSAHDGIPIYKSKERLLKDFEKWSINKEKKETERLARCKPTVVEKYVYRDGETHFYGCVSV